MQLIICQMMQARACVLSGGASLQHLRNSTRCIRASGLDHCPTKASGTRSTKKTTMPLQSSQARCLASGLSLNLLPARVCSHLLETAEVARVMRHAIMCHTTDPIPEGISGHRPGGKPTTKPHIAFLPLPYIGHRHSDGRLLGVALSFPQLLDDSSRRAALRAIGHWEEKNGGELELQLRSGKIRMSRLQLLSALQSLLRGSWKRSIAPVDYCHSGSAAQTSGEAGRRRRGNAIQSVDGCRIGGGRCLHPCGVAPAIRGEPFTWSVSGWSVPCCAFSTIHSNGTGW